MTKLEKSLAILAIVLGALLVYGSYRGTTRLFGATCASGQTCLPSIELTGPNSGVTNSLQIDTGAFTTSGGITVTAGGITSTGTLAVTGALTTTGGITDTNAATSTLKMKSTSTTQGFCLEFDATSSLTVLNMTFAGTSSPTTVGIAPIIRYGVCN